MTAVRWPLPCPTDCTVAVVAPASAVSVEKLQPGLDWLAQAGWQPQVGAHAYGRHRYLAGDDEARAGDLNQAICSPEVNGIIAARGGYGTMRTLSLIDWEAWRISRKPLTGFSDVTALQLALYKRTGLVSYSGFAPAADVVAARAPEPMIVDSFCALFRGRRPTPLVASGCCRAGEAHGVLLGGCLSLVVSLLGTPWMPSLKGAVLILEDVGEEPYRIDRMLTQLQLAGVWQDVAGVVFGQFHNCPDPHGHLPELFAEVAKAVSGPVVFDAPYGHQASRVVVPIGAQARLVAADSGWRLTFVGPEGVGNGVRG